MLAILALEIDFSIFNCISSFYNLLGDFKQLQKTLTTEYVCTITDIVVPKKDLRGLLLPMFPLPTYTALVGRVKMKGLERRPKIECFTRPSLAGPT